MPFPFAEQAPTTNTGVIARVPPVLVHSETLLPKRLNRTCGQGSYALVFIAQRRPEAGENFLRALWHIPEVSQRTGRSMTDLMVLVAQRNKQGINSIVLP